MQKVYTLKITYKDCKNKIWRQMQVSENMRMVDLGYLIISSFDTSVNKLFSFIKDNMEYEMFDESYLDTGIMYKEAISSLELKKGDEFNFIYDYECVQGFEILVLDVSETEDPDDFVPRILAGEGKGVIDGLTAKQLLSCIEEIDKTGKSETANSKYYAKDWDYKDYDPTNDDEIVEEQLDYLKEVYETFDPTLL